MSTAIKHPVTIETIEDSETIRMWRHHGRSRRLVVCFSGLGTPETAPKVEFAQVATREGFDSAIFVADPKRTWLNTPGFLDSVIKHVTYTAYEMRATEVVSIGNSMGGFSAMALASCYPLKAAVAFSPQFSVHPHFAPEEERWLEYRAQIHRYRVRSLGRRLVAQTQFYAFHGDTPDEAMQCDLFPIRPNLHHFVMPKSDESLAYRLRRQGTLAPLVNDCFGLATDKVAETMSEMGAEKRTVVMGREGACAYPPAHMF
ncbi:hypothetical protein BV394_09355 [Brevirhabdus pacifica]|uniref:Uncharacterized protein n=1 Tax=Brevirhabdus pacifica TaxID=1267768 RepID=A0A1U7DIZ4_9RHOB|nr:YqiA/YcfP family alpha/beta fold hydrolase [Brevirhabdus pacifica]APX89895.1 hypothetical protein BV394_09355 [Brevirhabdus pacifica]OWU74378.1 hypothetical protein ATO5_14270 [Loktanella sp. 22II-4b]PJJ82880.1 uncharacterized protein UPF0227 [Brevirhabdus pacifica]